MASNGTADSEEIDLCWRLKNMGYKIMVCPKSVVYHVGGHIITYGSPTKVYRNFRNSLITNLKNMPLSEVWWKIPTRMTLDQVYQLKVLLSGNWKECMNIYKAHFHFILFLPKWVQKRRQARQLVRNANKTGIYPGSIVWAYFVKSVKTFKGLNFR